MKLLAHRGLWEEGLPKNSLPALVAALDAGLGVETDVRDLNGRLVISHDMPTEATQVDLDAFLANAAKTPQSGLLALNIKSDGLQARLQQHIAAQGLQDRHFVFDMSVPDLLGWRRTGQPWAVRLSEYEDGGPLLEEARFVWLDAFERDDWFPDSLLERLLAQGKTVALVSPELHRRPHATAWQRWRRLDQGSDRLWLCTDLVRQAQETFDV
jgi:glycerophosphoryl diester phosphodiesterase